MKEPEEPEIDLEAEYGRLSENEKIFRERISLWHKLERITLYLVFVSVIPMLTPIFWMPTESKSLYELYPDYPMQVSVFAIGAGIFFASVVAKTLLSDKVGKIRAELGLNREERLYLRAYETYKNIKSYINEPNPNRKVFFKKMALVNAEKANRIVDGWNYGNIGLIRELMGDQIDLFKDNFRRLVLSNIAKGDETALNKITEILTKFCKYLHSSSIEGFNELNGLISGLKYRKYEVLTRNQKIGKYFYSRPRAFRLLFGFVISIIVALVLSYLGQNIGVIFGVSAACFWGALSQSDKIFRLKKE